MTQLMLRTLLVCCLLLAALCADALAGGARTPFAAPVKTITVGPDKGDIKGSDNVALQRAIDQLASSFPEAAGVLVILPGTYTMRDSLHVRTPVTIRGAGKDTILKKCPQVNTILATDLPVDGIEFRVKDPTGLAVGCGVTVRYNDRAGAWGNVMRTITAINGDLVRIDRPAACEQPYGRPTEPFKAGTAVAQNGFPLIAVRSVSNVVIEDLVIDGNLAENPNVYVDGCRNGGIYLNYGKDCAVRRVEIHHFNGDGLSYQTVDNVTVEDVESHHNAGYGLHPGTGSLNTVMRNCKAHHNGDIGLWVCWNVRGGLFENLVLEDNVNFGISIGHNDSDNTFLNCQIRRNGKTGIVFRNDGPMPHRCVFRGNIIEDNGTPGKGGRGFEILFPTNDIIFEGNTLRDTHPEADRVQTSAIKIKSTCTGFDLGTGNTIENGTVDIPASALKRP